MFIERETCEQTLNWQKKLSSKSAVIDNNVKELYVTHKAINAQLLVILCEAAKDKTFQKTNVTEALVHYTK